MSDTDSVVLSYPLPDYQVGEKIGQMKLEQKISKGLFFKKKFYCIINSNNQEIIKASGLDSSKLNYNSIQQLLNGESISIERTKFNLDWETLGINAISSNIEIQGLKGEIKTIYNTPDVNYKYISFPIKYSIIINPEYSNTTVTENTKQNTENIIKVSTPSVNIIQDESDLYLIFSKIEIIIFLISITLLIILFFIYKLL